MKSILTNRLRTLTALLFCGSSFLRAAAVFEDFTSYTADASLNNISVATGTGLTGNWAVANASSGVGRRSGTLTYNGFDAAGNVTGGKVQPLNNFQDPTLSASITTPLASEVFVQFLFNIPALPSSGNTANDTGIRMNVGGARLGFYIPGTDEGAAGEGNIFIGTGWTGGTTSPVTFSTATTYMMVGRLEHDGTEFTTASLWLNPVGSSYDNITSSAASVTGVDISSLDIASLSQVSFTWEDVRKVSSPELGAVTVIPEPGTLALVGLALGSLLAFRRRK